MPSRSQVASWVLTAQLAELDARLQYALIWPINLS